MGQRSVKMSRRDSCVSHSITPSSKSATKSTCRPAKLRPVLRFCLPRQQLLSATFNLLHHQEDAEQKPSAVDINSAGAFEMCSRLPGVTQEIAAGIIRQRNVVGAFSRVEDVALASGVGADVLFKIRPYIRVSSRSSTCVSPCFHQSVSTSSGVESWQSTDDYNLCSEMPIIPIHVNSATMFELMQIECVSQQTANSIIVHRDRHGPFRSLRQLNHVKGISRNHAKQLMKFLTLDGTADEQTDRTNTPSCLFDHQVSLNNHSSQNSHSLGQPKWSFFDVCELLSLHSDHPSSPTLMESTCCIGCNDHLAICSWNLDQLSVEKAGNPGVMEVICRSVLENSWRILLVHHVLDEQALEMICHELNEPSLRRIRSWPGSRGDWRFFVSRNVHKPEMSSGLTESSHRKINQLDQCCSGLIYDASSGIHLKSISSEDHSCPDTCSSRCSVSIKAEFSVSGTPLTIAALHNTRTESCSSNSVSCNCLVSFVKNNWCSKKSVKDGAVVLIEENSPLSSDQDLSELERLGFVRDSSTDTAMNKHLTSDLRVHWTKVLLKNCERITQEGASGVIRSGLSHPAIPNGWRWGGHVGSYRPMWLHLWRCSGSRHQTRHWQISSCLTALQAEYLHHEELMKDELKTSKNVEEDATNPILTNEINNKL